MLSCMSGRHSAKATLASMKPSGEPQSKVRPLIVVAVERLLLLQLQHGVGELDLVAGAALLVFQHREYLRLQDVAAVDVEIRRRGAGLRLLDHAGDLEAGVDVLALADDAVFVGLGRDRIPARR